MRRLFHKEKEEEKKFNFQLRAASEKHREQWRKKKINFNYLHKDFFGFWRMREMITSSGKRA
jgi:hypothetical protein